MKESGFCKRHSGHNNSPIEAPLELTALMEFLMCKVILNVASTFREYSRRCNLIEAHPRTCMAESVSGKIISDATQPILFLEVRLNFVINLHCFSGTHKPVHALFGYNGWNFV
jgi:hypothetical protein